MQEQAYKVYLNEGDLLFVLSVKDSKPDKPMLIYDGGDHAVLYRSKEQTILLDYLHEKVREPLTKVKTVLIAEFQADGKTLLHEYEVPVKQVKSVPLPSEGIITPEEVAKGLKDLAAKSGTKPKSDL
jgi:hypothetical protein